MPIRIFEEKKPIISPSAYVDETAVIIGDVVIGENSSIWPMVVIRGDINSIHIGDRTSIQDGTIIHVTHAGIYNSTGHPVIVGNDVTVGHHVTLHGCTIANHCLIGMSCTVMDGVCIESEVVLGAGSLVPPNKILEGGYLWLGNPAKKIRPLTDKERAQLDYSARYYVSLKDQYTAKPPLIT